MNKQDEFLDEGKRLAIPKDLDAELFAAFSKTSAIGLAILDSPQRFRLVNTAVATYHGIPADAFVGSTLRDIIGDAAPEPEARFKRVAVMGETPAVEVALMLPLRTELGYWIEKNFAIHGRSGRVIGIASLAVEVTANRKLEERFRKLGGGSLPGSGYQRLARELYASMREYHGALVSTLNRLSRCTQEPEDIPELLARSIDFVDSRMRKFAAVVAECFSPVQH